MTAEHAINDYLAGKYPRLDTKYVFGMPQKDALTKKASGVIEADYEHDGHRQYARRPT